MNNPHDVISEILMIRFATFFDTDKSAEVGANIVLNALDRAGFEVTRKKT